MMIGFLSGLYLAMRRCILVRLDADIMLHCAIIGLVVGAIGARVFFVAHYWQVTGAVSDHPIREILDFRQGGLEFLGGLLPAMACTAAYIRLRGASVRLYMDIIAVMIVWSLGFGRLGCFLNGCCYGSPSACVAAVTFPFGSPASIEQWESRQQTLPAELIFDRYTEDGALFSSTPIDRSVTWIDPTMARRAMKNRSIPPTMQAKIIPLRSRCAYPSRGDPSVRSSPAEIQTLARSYSASRAHPTQLYSAVAALLLANLLARVFHRRRRHGVVFGLLMACYGVTRFAMEAIRADNPADVFGMTASQALSLLMMFVGVAWLVVVYRFLPERAAAATSHQREPRVYDIVFPKVGLA